MATGKRLRVDFRSGALDAPGVDNVAVTLSSADFANLPTITAGSNQYLAISIGTEIMHVTEHAASATTVTVEREREGSTATSHAAGATWEHAPTARDYEEATEALLSGNSGTAYTIDTTVSVHRVTLTGNVAFTFTGALAGWATSFTLILVQDATGGRTVTWPTGTRWPAGTAPSLTTAANAVDVLTFVSTDGGTVWLGFLAGRDVK